MSEAKIPATFVNPWLVGVSFALSGFSKSSRILPGRSCSTMVAFAAGHRLPRWTAGICVSYFFSTARPFTTLFLTARLHHEDSVFSRHRHAAH